MTMPASLRRFWIQLTADRRRFGLLVAALCIGLLLWGRLIVVRQPPRMALANDAAAPAAQAGVPKPQRLPGADNSKSRSNAMADEQTRKRSPIAVELCSSPQQDPFVISPHYFPKPPEIVETTQKEDKSKVNPVEEAGQAEARLTAQLRATVERMKLEAAVAGTMAAISGKKYRLGDVIANQPGSVFQFTLVEIRQRSVMLECEGHQFELEMATPGT